MTQHARLNGHVVRIDRRQGTTNGRQWVMHIFDVMLKGGATTTTTVMPDDQGAVPIDLPRVGEEVDLLVDFGVRTRGDGGSLLTCGVISTWEAQPNIIGLLTAGHGVPKPVPARVA